MKVMAAISLFYNISMCIYFILRGIQNRALLIATAVSIVLQFIWGWAVIAGCKRYYRAIGGSFRSEHRRYRKMKWQDQDVEDFPACIKSYDSYWSCTITYLFILLIPVAIYLYLSYHPL